MRNRVTLYVKTMRLIDSVQTKGQFMTAKKYADLATPKLYNVEANIIYDNLTNKLKELVKH